MTGGVALQRIPADEAERRRALDPTASFIVQAPAGSGKTTLLVQRFLVLLDRVAEPESIVAITFTRKAAGEMRERVIEALTRALEDPGANEAAASALARDRAQGWNLRDNPSRLRIQTIDSLCAGIVQRMPWMARTGGMPGIVEDARELYREAARNALRRLARPARQLLAHLDNDFNAVQAMLEDLLPRRDQWLRHLGVGADPVRLRGALEGALQDTIRRALRRAHAHIPPIIGARLVDSISFAGRNLDPPREALNAMPGVEPEDLVGWRRIRDALLTGKGEWRRSVTAREGFPAHARHAKEEFAELLSAMADNDALLAALRELSRLPDAHFSAGQWDVLDALLTLLPEAAAELKLVFREKGAVDFVELGEAARRALGPEGHPTDLALSLGHRIEHILVDEFQDTSISQRELLDKLVAAWEARDPVSASDRTLFLVGDPMQSIYRFREAEVGLFVRAKHEGLGGVACEPITLAVNFRSRPAVVEWVNRAFAGLFPAVEDAATGAVTYAESAAHRTGEANSGVIVHPLFTPGPRTEATLVAELAGPALQRGSTAILVRARLHASEIVAGLVRRGIPFRAVEFDLLSDRPAVLDLVALTRALLHLGDRASWLAVLRAPWCGMTLAELERLAGSDRRAPVWALLGTASEPHVVRTRSILAEELDRVRREPLRDCVERTWRRLGGPDCLERAADMSDCRAYLRMLEEMEEGGELPSFEALERRVSQLFAQPEPLPPGAPVVELMTIHKAKGLEFDTVIVPGLGREAAADGRALLRWAEVATSEGTSLVFAPVEASREDESDPIYSYLGYLDRQRGRNETLRLLYVAATRAREQLHLVGAVETGPDGAIRKPRAGTLLELLWPAVAADFAARVSRAAGTALDVATEHEPPPQLFRRLPTDWTPAARPPGVDQTPPDPLRFDWVGDTLRHAGTVAHAWLDRIAREGPDAWPTRRLDAARPAMQAALEGLGLNPEQTAEASRIVTAALERTLADPRGRWILTPHPDAASEYSIAAAEPDGSIQQLTLDRTFVDPQTGLRWIIDYKLSRHEGGGLEEFLDNERERYRERMNRYAKALQNMETGPIRVGLYHPLVAGWREWDPV